MTQEEKRLLLVDICARLPYKVRAQYYGSDEECYLQDTVDGIDITCTEPEILIGQYGLELEDIKLYLRSMSSMTDSEYKEYEKANDLDTLDSCETLKENLKTKSRTRISKWYHGTEWLNAHHFDYHGLIPIGLALEAPAGMYKDK